jgi:hypothetical protein
MRWVFSKTQRNNFLAKNAIKNLDSDIKFEDEEEDDHDEDEKQKKASSFNLLQPFGFIAKTAKTVVVDHALGTAAKLIKTGASTVGDVFNKKTTSSDYDYLKAKKYADYLDSVDPKLLHSRLIMGIISNSRINVFRISHQRG